MVRRALLSVYNTLGHCQDYHFLKVGNGGNRVELDTASYPDKMDEEALKKYYISYMKKIGSEPAGLEIMNSDLENLDPFNKKFGKSILRSGYRIAFFIPPRVSKTIRSLKEERKGTPVGGTTIHTKNTTFGGSGGRPDNYLFLFSTDFELNDFDRLEPYLNSFYAKYSYTMGKDPRKKLEEGIVDCAFSACLKVSPKQGLDIEALNERIERYRKKYDTGLKINQKNLNQAYSLFRAFSENGYSVFLNGSGTKSPSFAEITITVNPGKPSGYLKPGK